MRLLDYALVVAIMYSVCAVRFRACATKGSNNTKRNANTPPIGNVAVCRTPSCDALGKQVLDSVNVAVDPCDNFYLHACQKWQKNHVLETDESYADKGRPLKRNINQALIESLETDNATSSPLENKLKKLYEQCMDQEREQLRTAPLFELLEHLLGGWPVLKPDWDPSKFNTFETLVRMFSAAVEPFFRVDVQNEVKNPLLHKIVIMEPATFATVPMLADEILGTLFTEAYQQLMRDVTTLLIRDNRNSNMSTVSANLTDIFNIERSFILAGAVTTRTNTTKLYSLAALETKSPFQSAIFRNLTKYIRAYMADANLTYTLPDNITLDLIHPSALGNVDKLLVEIEQEGDEGKRRLANYIGWQIIKTRVELLSTDYLDLWLKYISKITGMPENTSNGTLKVRCLRDVTTAMPLAVGALYVKTAVPAKLREKAKDVIIGVQEGFAQLLDEAAWLDNSTHKAALQKLHNLIIDVGYPAALLTDSSLLENHYADITVEETYMKSWMKIARSGQSRKLNRLAKLYIRDDPLDEIRPDVTQLGGFYNPYRNKFTINAATLHPPYFDPDGPEYVNYGALGTIVGHEIAHAFGNMAGYDDQGVVRNWWSTTSRMELDKRASCMMRQYDGRLTEYGKVNGQQTIGEDMADNAGYMAAYQAYVRNLKRSTVPEKVPAQLMHYSPEQLFFLSAAQVVCAKNRPGYARLWRLDYTQSPPERRVNGPLSNMPEFAKAFNCSRGANMFPQFYCKVW